MNTKPPNQFTDTLLKNPLHSSGAIDGGQRVDANQFPQLLRTYQGKPIVYLDNSATTPKPQRVIDAINSYYTLLSSNVHRGAHMLAERTTELFESSRLKVQKLVNAASPHEVIFTSGTTDSINLLARAYGEKHLKAGDEVLISEMEHHANIVPWQMLETRCGVKLQVTPILDDGSLNMQEFHKKLNKKTKLVAITHTSNALGVINPLQEIVSATHAMGAKVMIDGAQAVGHSRVDVQKEDIDFFVFSGHKLFGPTGIGVLVGKYDLLESLPPVKGGGEMIVSVKFGGTTFKPPPERFEGGTPPIAEVIGLGEAIDFVEEIGYPYIQQKEAELLEIATPALRNVEGLHIFGDLANKVPVFSFLLKDVHTHDVGFMLSSKGVAIRTGRHCAEPLMDRFGVAGTARASFSFYNTKEDVDRLVSALKECRQFFG